LGEIAVHLPDEDKIVTFPAADIALPLTKAAATSPPKVLESYHRSPTQQEVDAYVNSLEFEVSQEGVRMRQQRVEHGGQPALITAWRPKSSGLLWCVVAAV